MVTGPTVMRLPSDLARFRAHRRTHKHYTYIRLTGNLATLPPEALVNASEGTTVVDLEAVVFERGQVAAWRAYLHTAKSKVRSLQLLGCPPWFLESALSPTDLEDKVRVRTFTLRHPCDTCNTMTTQVIDVAKHIEQLVAGELPPTRCNSCRSSLVAPVTYEQGALLRALHDYDKDDSLENFLAQVRAEPVDKLENCLQPLPLPQAKPPVRSKRRIYVAAAFGVLLAGAVVVKVLDLGQEPQRPRDVVAPEPVVTPPPPPPQTFTRPDWIVSDVPSSASCQELLNRLTCVGVSSFRTNRDEAAAEATDAALDELVSTIGLKITTPVFRDTIVSNYSDARTKVLYELQMPNDEVVGRVVTARKRVVKALQASGGGGVPAQRSDWHWEEYAAEDGAGTEYLVFIRFDISVDAMRSLIDKYSTTTPMPGGTIAMTAFPALGWRRADFTGGALLTKVSRPLAAAGIRPHTVVVAVGDQRVVDAAGFARAFDQSPPGELALTIAVGDEPETVVRVRR